MVWGWSLDAAEDLRIERTEKERVRTANGVDKPEVGTEGRGRLGAWVSFCFQGFLLSGKL